jgi:hypothetical protein
MNLPNEKKEDEMDDEQDQNNYKLDMNGDVEEFKSLTLLKEKDKDFDLGEMFIGSKTIDDVIEINHKK